MKKSCISAYIGKPRSCYETYEQAQNSADYMKTVKRVDFYPYKCNQCGYYHLALKKDKINFRESGCFCTDSNGNRKNLYATYKDALKAKSKAEAKRNVELEIYECPEGEGWHLTHRKEIRSLPTSTKVPTSSKRGFGYAVFTGIAIMIIMALMISLY